MEISLFLEPVGYQLPEKPLRPGRKRLGETLVIYNEKDNFPDLSGIKLALIGVQEERGAIHNEGCSTGISAVREAFYELFDHWPGLQMADLGDVKPGHSIEDTYFALSQLTGQLIRNNIIPIIIGGSQDITFAMYQAYENIGRLVNIAAIDPIFDLGQEAEELHAQSYLSRIIMHQPNYLFNFTNLGYQTYDVDHEAVDLMKNLLFDVHRLGMLKEEPKEAEPPLRNADIVSFDIAAVRAADAPGCGNAGPNGFTGDEACRLARYAGMSDKLSAIGFFEYNPLFDPHKITAQLIAQMLWYFIEGFINRKNDLPEAGSDDFSRYNVRIEGQEEAVVFIRSKKTERWWIDLSFGRTDRKKYERHHFVPCSQADYELALTDELPDRWWQFFQKLM
ncbi:MAG: formimidoylglutamase [Bacteroidetes bacterium]|nr:formimidoylglutamase [Bacteroidota bacterium]MBU1579166.1 formimidoylglutamase [Bacteroidota bacterium]MBU2465711.1 formimidoylglutamase [Bacteroidota bacterium]MBU2558678.1 formimidoylglutamase [Bacteroidota bacterium]